MSKVDWSKAPEGAQYYANNAWWKANQVKCGWLVLVDDVWLSAEATSAFMHTPFAYRDVESIADHIVDASKKVWPSESRIDIIGTNGNTGEAYVHYDEFREKVSRGPSVYNNAPKGNPSATTPKGNYERLIIGLDGTKTAVDVYRVLDAFKTESAAIDHAIKKLLAPGLRHSKDRKQDLKEAIDSIAAELLLMEQK